MDDENPYASPTSYDESVRPRFRPSRIAGWGYWILRGCDRRSGRAKGSPDLVLQSHPFLTVFLWMVAIGGPIMALIIALANPPEPHEWWAPWLLGGMFLAAGVVGLFADERVTFASDAIRKVGPFKRRRQMPWSDVVSVAFEKDGEVVLISGNGTRIRIEPDMVGVVDMVDVLENCLPHDVLQDCAIDLGSYRRFVGAGRAHSAPRNEVNAPESPIGPESDR